MCVRFCKRVNALLEAKGLIYVGCKAYRQEFPPYIRLPMINFFPPRKAMRKCVDQNLQKQPDDNGEQHREWTE